MIARMRVVMLLCAIGCASCGTNGSDGKDAAVAVTDLASGDLATQDLGAPAGSALVYVSGYSTTIGRYSLDAASGALTAIGTTTATGSPSFLAFDVARSRVFAIDEANSKVESFGVTDVMTGAMAKVGADVGSGGSGPAHVAVDASGKWVLAANYGSGDVGIIAVAGDGSLGAVTSVHAGVKAHETVLSADGKLAWVPCLGSQYVAQYAWDASAGMLSPAATATVMTPAGAGPRHLAVVGASAYLVEETDSMIGVYSVDAGGGGLTLVQRLSSRDAAATGTNTGAEVQVHPSGKWVYVSNRGDDDIGVYAVGGADGKLTAVAHVKTGGATPRHFSIDPSGRWLLVANQGSGDVRVLAVDGATGVVAATGVVVTATMPSFVGVYGGYR